jgi:hypothetical protein
MWGPEFIPSTTKKERKKDEEEGGGEMLRAKRVILYESTYMKL